MILGRGNYLLPAFALGFLTKQRKLPTGTAPRFVLRICV